MGDASEFSLTTRLFLKTYPWRRIDPVPCAPLRKPLRDARIAIVTTAGLHLPTQQPFDNEKRGGDTSYRVIPNDADVSSLLEAHRSETFDHAGVRSDPNLAFPLDRLHEMQLNLAPRHLSFMGSITAPNRLIKESAPEAAQLLVDDGVEAALLVPV
ncbi:MAG TPA: glycine/sarcosine/betaine reductase selenoprotein B family protein [Thermoanaerobaculia bacterium]|nr:glycine/sarcosine/betaine reductase selenoprotein B family protein [Thermoanaerobaculia bacterium]